jgi:hypothetical protein
MSFQVNILKGSGLMKLVMIVLISFILVGCVTIEARHSFTPQKVANWKDLGGRIYQFECNECEITVAPLVLRSSEVREQEKPWIYVRFSGPKRIENCDLSFVTLENKITGERVVPMSAKTNVYNDDYFKKKTTDCYYYFNIGEEKGSIYNLYITDKVFGCTIDPIPYVYEEYTEWRPMQVM